MQFLYGCRLCRKCQDRIPADALIFSANIAAPPAVWLIDHLFSKEKNRSSHGTENRFSVSHEVIKRICQADSEAKKLQYGGCFRSDNTKK